VRGAMAARGLVGAWLAVGRHIRDQYSRSELAGLNNALY